MGVDHVLHAPWIRKHDLAGTGLTAPKILFPKSLGDLIDLCTGNPPGTHLKAAGSHWALSRAAISDEEFIETHDPNDVHTAMGRTLYEVVPGCMSDGFLRVMANRRPPAFNDPEAPFFDGRADYLVHIETGKRIYQLYAELDQGDDANRNEPSGPPPVRRGSLAWYLDDEFRNPAYHGPWAFRTLGGAGGQTVFGALSTGTHGGDFRLPPIADDVAALHLVADGGRHFWIEPGSQPEDVQLTDDDRLHATYGGLGEFEIIRDDDVFHAVLIAAGRFGVVYSIVLRAVRQYSLHERRRLTTWQNVRGLISDPRSSLYRTGPNRSNRFLQIAVCLTSHANFQRNLAGVTNRWNALPQPDASDPNGRRERVGRIEDPHDPQIQGPRFEFAGDSIAYAVDPNDPNQAAAAGFLERACSNGDFLEGVIESAAEEIRQLIEEHQVAVGSAIAAVAVVGGVGTLLAIAAALSVILALLLAFAAAMRAAGGGHRLGQVMNDVKDELLDRPNPAERTAGLFAWQLIAYKVFSSQQKNLDYDAISYAVMDLHDYHDQSCNVNVDSIEVFFDATDPMLIAFVDALLAYETRQELRGKAFVGYVSLRFTAQTRALIGMERWPLTCAVEVAGLKDVTGVTELIDFAIALSRDRNFGGILHWGQRNESDAGDIEFRFGDPNDPHNGALGRWRKALARITDDGDLDAFSSQFTRDTGLEAM